MRKATTSISLLLLAFSAASTAGSTTSFSGTFTRTSVSPDVCVDTTNCDYQCSAEYTATVSNSVVTMYPVTNPSGCECLTLTATIDGNTAAGASSSSTYSLQLTSSGIQVIASTSGVVCTGSYTKTTDATTTSNDGRAYSTASVFCLLASVLATFYY